MFNLVCRCQKGKHLLSKVTKADHIDQSAAISARIFQSFACRKVESDRIPPRNKAMVIIRPGRRQVPQDEDVPDWSEVKQDDEEDWHIASYDEIEVRLRHDLKLKNVHAVDVVSIGTNGDPIPM